MPRRRARRRASCARVWLAWWRRRPHREFLFSPSRSFPGVVCSGIACEDGGDLFDLIGSSGRRAASVRAGRRLAQCWVRGLRLAASVVSSDVVGRRRRSRRPEGVGKIPGRRATKFWFCRRWTVSSTLKAALPAMAPLRPWVWWQLIPLLRRRSGGGADRQGVVVFLRFWSPCALFVILGTLLQCVLSQLCC